MQILPVLVRSDNYAYVVIDDVLGKGTAVLVDPYDLDKVEAAAKHAGVHRFEGLLTTHRAYYFPAPLLSPRKGEALAPACCVMTCELDGPLLTLARLACADHYDHAGGNKHFAKKHPHAPIYGGSREKEAVTTVVAEGNPFPLQAGSSIEVTPLATPCHTQDSLCYLLTDHADVVGGQPRRAVFTGDTLFISGCGRFFEGSAEEMLAALTKLANLPPDTLIYNGHEYTKSNVSFSLGVLPDRPAVQRLAQDVRDSRNSGILTGTYTIAEERQHNPFLLTSDQDVQHRVGSSGKGQTATMSALREAKNQGKFCVPI